MTARRDCVDTTGALVEKGLEVGVVAGEAFGAGESVGCRRRMIIARDLGKGDQGRDVQCGIAVGCLAQWDRLSGAGGCRVVADVVHASARLTSDSVSSSKR